MLFVPLSTYHETETGGATTLLSSIRRAEDMHISLLVPTILMGTLSILSRGGPPPPIPPVVEYVFQVVEPESCPLVEFDGSGIGRLGLDVYPVFTRIPFLNSLEHVLADTPSAVLSPDAHHM